MPTEFSSDLLLGGWLHSHEEDTPNERIFRPDSYPFPPSRGRYGYEFLEGGSLVLLEPGATDRRVTKTGTWELGADNELVLHPAAGEKQTFRIQTLEPDRLVFRR